MNQTRIWAVHLRLAVLGAAALSLALLAPAVQAESGLEAETRRVLATLFEALTSGDPAKVDPWLAPEFQLVRATGDAFDKAEYLERGIPKISSTPKFDDLVVTRNGDIIVARMRMRIEEDLQGKKAKSGAPQLFVFRRTPGGWQVVASGNFAKLVD